MIGFLLLAALVLVVLLLLGGVFVLWLEIVFRLAVYRSLRDNPHLVPRGPRSVCG
jgi:phosphoglycerol transferase MdoB-like AlkP superfamily enzyme